MSPPRIYQGLYPLHSGVGWQPSLLPLAFVYNIISLWFNSFKKNRAGQVAHYADDSVMRVPGLINRGYLFNFHRTS